MTLEEKLDKVKGKLAKLNSTFKGARGVSEPPEVARKRRKIERKRFKLERALARMDFCVRVIIPNADVFQTGFEFVQESFGNGDEQVSVIMPHPVSKRKLSVTVFTRGNMNAKIADLESDSSLGTTSLVRVRIEDNGRLVHSRSVRLQDRKVDIDELLLSNNPLLWDVYTLPEDDKKAFETVKAALTAYLEAITPCTVRGLGGQDEDDDE